MIGRIGAGRAGTTWCRGGPAINMKLFNYFCKYHTPDFYKIALPCLGCGSGRRERARAR